MEKWKNGKMEKWENGKKKKKKKKINTKREKAEALPVSNLNETQMTK
jgi:hypothetical protein